MNTGVIPADGVPLVLDSFVQGHSFRARCVPPGRFRVKVSGAVAGTADSFLLWYRNRVDPGRASLVRVRTGEVVRLAPQTARFEGAIFGTVLTHNGRPASDVTVAAVIREPNKTLYLTGLTPSADSGPAHDDYYLPDVPPGRWLMVAYTSAAESALRTTRVKPGGVTNAGTLRLSRPLRLHGARATFHHGVLKVSGDLTPAGPHTVMLALGGSLLADDLASRHTATGRFDFAVRLPHGRIPAGQLLLLFVARPVSPAVFTLRLRRQS